ncbi:MAG: cytidine deaminase, partial [Rhodanobacter sp.]
MPETSTMFDDLFALASAAREHAYAPYSHFLVGAALLTRDG